MSQQRNDILKEAATLLANEITVPMGAVRLGGSKLQASVEVKVSGADSLAVEMEDYARYVIQGRRPGGKKVPISALLSWLKSKRLQGRDKRGRFITYNSLAWAIQTAIFRRGIAGRDFITPAVKEFEEEAVRLLEKHLEETMEEIIDQWAKDRPRLEVG